MSVNTIVSVVFLSVLSLFLANESISQCKLKIDNSEFEGKLRKTWTGKYYCSFFGIPYAVPPKRFEPSQVQDVYWNGLKTFKMKPEKCLQFNDEKFTFTLIGSEDCLYLDIHTTGSGTFNMNRSDPVLVWLHGGTFNFGSGQEDITRPDLFIDRDIIVVTVNYRLGPLGFFSYPNKNIIKNLGLRDQITALQWIKKYIYHFGGNARNVTLAGWSAGSAAVTYHLYTNLSKGLFQKAIAMSGTFLNPWAFNIYSNISSKNWCESFPINCDDDDSNNNDRSKAIERLKETPLNVYSFNTFEYWFIHFNMYFPSFIPTIEEENNSDDNNGIFISNQPHLLINQQPKNDVPLLIGYTSLEENCDVFSPNDFFMTNFTFPYSRIEVFDFLTDLLTDEKFNKEKYNKFTNLRRIADTIYGVKKFTENYSKNSNNSVFMYKFSLSRRKNKKTDSRCTIEAEEGAFHGDDIKLLFGQYFQVRKIFNRNVENTQKEMANLWSNFIYLGNPTPFEANNITWPQYNTEKETIMDINENLSLQNQNQDTSEMYTLWNLIYDCLYNNNCDILIKSMSHFIS